MDKESLLKEWLKLKKAENKAKQNRLKIEEQIQDQYKLNPDEKSKTFKEEKFSINIKKNVVYKLNEKQWILIRQEIPENFRPEKISFSLDLKGFEYLKENEDLIYKKISDCVEFKENKSTITVEKI